MPCAGPQRPRRQAQPCAVISKLCRDSPGICRGREISVAIVSMADNIRVGRRQRRRNPSQRRVPPVLLRQVSMRQCPTAVSHVPGDYIPGQKGKAGRLSTRAQTGSGGWRLPVPKVRSAIESPPEMSHRLRIRLFPIPGSL